VSALATEILAGGGMAAVIGGVCALASVFGFAVRQQREGKRS
jgi:hypothetical protein